MKKGPFKMKGISFKEESPVKKNTQKQRDKMTPAERLLSVVPNKAAYDKLSDEDKKGFIKAAKKAGLPTKFIKK